jgi:hypothetical protein
MGFGAKGKWDGVKKGGGGGDRRAPSKPGCFRHCERSEAIHLSVHEVTMDCFAALAMTWIRLRDLAT